MLKINSIKPLFNKIIVSCNLYEEDERRNGIIVNTKGTIKEYQTVEAVGSTVRDLAVGDIVMINPKRYIVPNHQDKHDKSLKGVIGDNLTLAIDFPILEYGDKKHIILYDQDIDYIIEGEEVKEEPLKSPLILPKEKKVILN